MTLKTATPAEILALPMQQPNDADAATVGDYLISLLALVWKDTECSNGKRPFGNSGWDWDLYIPLVKANLILGDFDEYGELNDCDNRAADKLIAGAIQHLRTAVPGAAS